MKPKHLSILVLLLIILGAIWVRTYNYHDWLFFKWDQAREAVLLAPAIEHGPEHLPLLGPRATKVGDDYLRLGPAFYYVMYLSGVIFSSTAPEVFAYPDLFFSILVIPLLYFFLRLYFSRPLSLVSTGLYSSSFIIIQHSRFAWNPNAVPFFILLAIYSLLRFSSVRQKNKSNWEKLGWLSLWAFATSIATQYHFFAAFTLIGISGLYFIYLLWKNHPKKSKSQKVKKIALHTLRQIITKKFASWSAVVVVIFALIYVPMIVSESLTSWSNTKNFFFAFSEKPKDKPFSQKVIRNFREQAKNYSLILTSFDQRPGKKADPLTVGFGLIFVIGSLTLIAKERKLKSNPHEKDFLFMLIIWTVVFFFITITVSYSLRPRYFTSIYPIPFAMLALWFAWIQKKFVRGSTTMIGSITLLFFALNVFGTFAWFEENRISEEKQIKVRRTLILKKKDGVTLSQLEKAVDWIHDKKTNNQLLYYAKPEYTLPIKYLLYQKKDPKLKYELADSESDLFGKEKLLVILTGSGGIDSIKKEIANHLELTDKKQFGQLIAAEMKIVPKNVPAPKEKDAASVIEGKTQRLFWRDIFGTDEDLIDIEIGSRE